MIILSIENHHKYLQARDIYEEAIDTVTTVRDFTQIFDAYSQFEESVISSKMEKMAESESHNPEGIACFS